MHGLDRKNLVENLSINGSYDNKVLKIVKPANMASAVKNRAYNIMSDLNLPINRTAFIDCTESNDVCTVIKIRVSNFNKGISSILLNLYFTIDLCVVGKIVLTS